jgi:hypothetical protein
MVQLELEGTRTELNVEVVCVNVEVCQAVIPFWEFLQKAVLNSAAYFRCPMCGGTAWKVREKK